MKNRRSAMDVAMFLLSIVAIIIVISSYFVDHDIELYQLLIALDGSICILFLLHFFSQMLRADSKVAYIKIHWIDFLASIPFVEPMRFARIFLIIRVFRTYRRKHEREKLTSNVRDVTAAGVLLLVSLVIIFGSMAILVAEEHNPASHINTGFDALWWALVTVSTVGYGDLYPVSSMGRIVGSVLIITGVGTFGILSGLVSSIVLKPNQKAERRLEVLIENQSSQNQELLTQMAQLQELVESQQATIKQQLKAEQQTAAKNQAEKDSN